MNNPNAEFQIVPASRESSPVIIAIAGISGSGKTYSSLLLARGLVGQNGKIVVIDTEGKRSLIYADDPDIGGFLHMDMRPQYSSERMTTAVNTAVDANADCILIDSASPEHDGMGGMLDFHDQEVERILQRQKDAGRPYKDPGFSAWIKPKQAHKKFVQSILGAPCHVIMTLRQHEVSVVDPKKQGGRVGDKVISTICDSQLLFEATLAVVLNEQYQPTYTKVPKPLQNAIRQGEPLTMAHGALLANESTGLASDTPEPYVIHYPGGKTLSEPNLKAYADQILKSAARAGDKLEEFRALNIKTILDRVTAENDMLASKLVDALDGGTE